MILLQSIQIYDTSYHRLKSPSILLSADHKRFVLFLLLKQFDTTDCYSQWNPLNGLSSSEFQTLNSLRNFEYTSQILLEGTSKGSASSRICAGVHLK